MHLLIKDDGDKNDIPAMIQLVAERTGQGYNSTMTGRKIGWPGCAKA
jgi:hypothetical protein